MDIAKHIRDRLSETRDLHRRHLNPQLVRVLEVIGYYRDYVSARGAWLETADGERILDFLSGFGVFNIGRNHPLVKQVLRDMLDLETASLVQMDAALPAGLLAEALCEAAPGDLDAVFFTNSGTESVEGAIKFAVQATGRRRIVYCDHAFHGLTLGSLSVNGNPEFRDRNLLLLPDCTAVPFGDLSALESAIGAGDAAAFIVEPVQGKGVYVPPPEYFPAVRELCDRTGTLLIADEVQTGMGRTGRMFAMEHWGVAPDILAVSKALSGGFIPVGAVLTRREIHGRVFDSMERCFAHSNTFGQNDLAMAAGLATLQVLRAERLPERAAETGAYLLDELRGLARRYELLAEVRGLGLMIGLQFGEPRSRALKTAWRMIHKMNEDLFGQMITMPLFEKHRILTQVAGHGSDTVKILPPLIIGREEADRFLSAMEDVLKAVHRFPGAAWSTTTKLAYRTAKTA